MFSMRKLLFILVVISSVLSVKAQTLEKMQWFNEPEKWTVENQALSMFVTPKSDYW